MSTAGSGRMHELNRRRWFLPLASVAGGLVMMGASAAGGHLGLGLMSLGIMTAFGLAVFLGGGSETIRGLRGDGRDERFAQMDLTATAAAGGALTLAVIIGYLVDVARGHDGMPYAWLGAVAGLAYIVAIVVIRLRG